VEWGGRGGGRAAVGDEGGGLCRVQVGREGGRERGREGWRGGMEVIEEGLRLVMREEDREEYR